MVQAAEKHGIPITFAKSIVKLNSFEGITPLKEFAFVNCGIDGLGRRQIHNALQSLKIRDWIVAVDEGYVPTYGGRKIAERLSKTAENS